MGAVRRAWRLIRLVVGWSAILAVAAALLGSAVYGLTKIPAEAVVPLILLLGLWGWMLVNPDGQG